MLPTVTVTLTSLWDTVTVTTIDARIQKVAKFAKLVKLSHLDYCNFFYPLSEPDPLTIVPLCWRCRRLNYTEQLSLAEFDGP